MSATRIHVGAAPPRLEAYADFFDGEMARPRRAAISIEEAANGGATLIVRPPEAAPWRWPLDTLRRVPGQARRHPLALTSTVNPLARLYVGDAETAAILASRARRLARSVPVPGRWRLLTWAAAAVFSVLLILFILVPLLADRLALYLPPAGERALGETTISQIRGALGDELGAPLPLCDAPEGRRALDRIVERISLDSDLPYPVTVSVLDDEMVNAFALPGGQVAIFRGMIEAARTPEQVAAVLAHELAHVDARDPTRAALRTAGSVGILGLLLGDFAGGAVVLFLTEQLIEARYSQAIEAAADDFALRLLAERALPPAALGEIFERLRAEYGEAEGVASRFGSHPATARRVEEAKAAQEALAIAPRPLLSGSDWRALRRICTP